MSTMKQSELMENLRGQLRIYCSQMVARITQEYNTQEQDELEFFPTKPIFLEDKEKAQAHLNRWVDLRKQTEQLETFQEIYDFISNHFAWDEESTFHFMVRVVTQGKSDLRKINTLGRKPGEIFRLEGQDVR